LKVYFHLSINGFSNSYLVKNPITKEALIIDPGTITQEIINQIENEHYNLVAVLITHHEINNTRGVPTLRCIYSPKIYTADLGIAGNDTIVLKGDGSFKAAGLNIKYLSMPGHTSDSLCFKIGRVIFTGDALTAGLTGNSSNSYAEKNLLTNIEKKIFSQTDNTIIMPGQGPPSSVKAEKKFNLSFLKLEKHDLH
jgi:glyoxylase-like metal-dependent hydrolase (beta-lactamase superfamily II)